MKTVFNQINLENVIHDKRERKQNLPVVKVSTIPRPNGIKKKSLQNGLSGSSVGRKKKVQQILEKIRQTQPDEIYQQPPGQQIFGEQVPSDIVPSVSYSERPKEKLKSTQMGEDSQSQSSFEPMKKAKIKKHNLHKNVSSKQIELPVDQVDEHTNILSRLNKIFKKTYESKKISTESENNQVRELFKNYYQKWIQNASISSTDLDKLQEMVEEFQVTDSTDIQKQPHTRKILTLPEDGLTLDTRRNLKLLDIEVQNFNQKILENQTFINCDLRYFNLDYLTEKIGNFDIILMDPPWRIKGGQQNDSQFMFTNSKFSLEYNTMSNQEIMDIKVEKLSKKGFLFLWILNTQLNIAYEMASKWGYEIVDQIIWVKLNNQYTNVYLSTGYYFMHSFEICLVGYKCPPGEHVEYHSKISNNVLFSAVRKKSQKPIELYEIIELMMPGSKKIELFARNNNLRPGWFSLGNQLGETYKKWHLEINCNLCDKALKPGNLRFKSKKFANYDICQSCFEKQYKKFKEQKELNQEPHEPQNSMEQHQEFDPNSFFELMNKADEEILHQYHSCNHCGQEPIWGIRFECVSCENYDLCETCFDLVLSEEIHNKNHNFRATEIPVFAEGIPCHDSKCNGCFQKPILGVQFVCKQCINFSLCQNCFFTRTQQELSGLRHKTDHKLEPIYETQNTFKKAYRCQGCETEIASGNVVYKCENCFGFYFCEKCFVMKKDDWKCYIATSHKNYHTYIKLE